MKTRAAVAWEAGKPLEIEEIDIDTLTPVEALLKLHGIKKLLGSRK